MLRQDIETLPELLSAHSYNTLALVTGPLFQKNGIHRGFQEYIWRPPTQYLHTDWFEELKRILRQYSEQRSPWFVLLHLWELHHPIQISSKNKAFSHGLNYYLQAISSLDLYLGKLLKEIPENTCVILTGDHGENISKQQQNLALIKRYIPKSALLRKMLRGTIQAVAKWRQKSNVKELFHIGHGYALYDYLVNVPLVLCMPGIVPANHRISQQISQVDILPTIATILNVPLSGHIDGRELTPLLREDKLSTTPVYLELNLSTFPDPKNLLVAVRTPDFKYIERPFNQDVEPLLFNLRADPIEKHNLYSEDPVLLRTARDALAQFPRTELDQYIHCKHTLSEMEEEEISRKLKSLGYMG